jgi:hypothetical protein
MGLLVTALGIHEITSGFRARNWPAANNGRIEKIDANAKLCITFSYSAQGTRHTSNTTFVHEENSGGDHGPSCDPKILEKYRKKYQERSSVTVRYDPTKPGYGVLEARIPPAFWFMPGMGLVFVALAALIGIGPHIRTRQKRSLPLSGAAAVIGQTVPELTPSEIVLLQGARFAEDRLAGSTKLLDGHTSVSSRELVTMQLVVALLEHERQGTVEFKTEGKRVFVNTTGKLGKWPTPSLESRLEFRPGDDIAAVVLRWAVITHPDAWTRAAEKTFIPLVLRGLAAVTVIGTVKMYAYANKELEAAAATCVEAVSTALEKCRQTRPGFWDLMNGEIVRAVEAGEYQESAAAGDPWCDESDADVERILGLRFGRVYGPKQWKPYAITSGFVWVLIAVLAYYHPELRNSAFVSAALGILTTLSARLWWRRAALVAGLSQHKIDMLAADIQSIGWLKTTFTLAPIAALLATWPVQNANNPTVLFMCAAAVALAAFVMLQKKAGKAIVQRVSGGAKPVAQAALRTIAAATATGGASVVVPAAPELPFEVELIEPQALPPGSPKSLARLDAIRQRGPAIRKLYWTSVHLLAWPTAAIAAVMTFGFRSEGQNVMIPFMTSMVVGVTLFALFIAFINSKRRAAAASLDRFMRWLRRDSVHYKRFPRIRPLAAPFLGMVWVVWTISLCLGYLAFKTPFKWAAVVASLGLVLLFFYRVHTGRKKLEAQYPVFPPLNLLALRVFDSPNRDRFLELLELWHWFGPIYRLDGPDTAGGKATDVIAYLTGHLDMAIIENARELQSAEKALKRARDSQLRFGINSMQCTDATWKDAIQHMFDEADVIVMDLSGLTRVNRGCAYEIGKLVNEVPFERFLFLVNDGTDLVFLREILTEAARRLPARTERAKVRIIQIGSVPERREEESVYEWQSRFGTVIDEDRLIGLLYDAAAQRAAPQPTPIKMHWTRPAFLPAPRG